MTEEQIKERISRHFVELLAARRGFKCTKPDPDNGVDLSISRALVQERDGKKRWLDTGEYVEIQLKCTCEGQVQWREEDLKYDLESKTYNDLVDRQSSGFLTPLILILLVLPDDPELWLTISTEEVILRRSAYWYQPPVGSERTSNTHTVRIEVPLQNKIGLAFFPDLFEQVYS